MLSNIVSTKKTNTIVTNVSINCYSEKVRHKIDCYVFRHSVISDHNTVDNYYYLLSLCKT